MCIAEVSLANLMKLEQLSFFRGADPEFLNTLASGSRLHFFPRGHVLYRGSQKLVERISEESPSFWRTESLRFSCVPSQDEDEARVDRFVFGVW